MTPTPIRSRSGRNTGEDLGDGWAAATCTIALVGGLYAASVLAIDAITNGSTSKVAVTTVLIGLTLVGVGLTMSRRSTAPRQKRIGVSTICAACVVAAVYGLSALA